MRKVERTEVKLEKFGVGEVMVMVFKYTQQLQRREVPLHIEQEVTGIKHRRVFFKQ